MSRVSWDQYFIDIAQRVATRATCSRKHVGAVIVLERRILATGYNGSIHGTPHCDEAGHLLVDGHCVRTLHAEANALIQCASNGVSTKGSTLYVTAYPCWNCAKLVFSAGIQRIIFCDDYRPDPLVEEHAKQIGVSIQKMGFI